MDNIIFAKYDMDSGCVQAWTENCNLILIDCDAVEKAFSENMYQRSQLDYLIYNASGYSSGVTTMKKLLEMSSLLADCKAFKESTIWWIGQETYQRSDSLSDLIMDVHNMIEGKDDSEMTFLHHME